jgi:hypothetical protein
MAPHKDRNPFALQPPKNVINEVRLYKEKETDPLKLRLYGVTSHSIIRERKVEIREDPFRPFVHTRSI